MSNHPNRSTRRDDPARNPDPAAIRAVREKAGLTQTAAGALIYVSLRGWQEWEAGTRKMHPAFWELFKLKTRAGR